MQFLIHKDVGQTCKVVDRLEEIGLNYSVEFNVNGQYMGFPTPVVEYLGVPMDEKRVVKLLDDMFGEEETHGN